MRAIHFAPAHATAAWRQLNSNPSASFGVQRRSTAIRTHFQPAALTSGAVDRPQCGSCSRPCPRSPCRESNMANKMLIDASQPKETRVVVLRGQKIEEFDFESASRKQLRGNIYLAKVTRVEPSLQAAFVEYGGNRHGFLAFSEIHPDYYQIPVADRQALIAEEERAHREAEDEVDRRAGRRRGRGAERRRDAVRSAPVRPEAGPEVSDQPEATADLAVSHEAQFTDGDAVSPAAREETRAPDEADGSADPSTRHE